MTKAKRDRICKLLREGALYRDAAAVAEVGFEELAADYQDNPRPYDAARAHCRNTLLVLAAEHAGSRASQDYRELVKTLSADAPPELAREDPLDHLWATAMPPELRAAVEEAIRAYPVDAVALADSAGDWTPSGAAAAATDHAQRGKHGG